jgi:aryl-alcohol dehydrogenase-like predicted oxidoreductase
MPDLIQKIGLGTVQFGTDYGISNRGGKVARDEVAKILEYFRTNGGSILDTASAYGSAEEVLGRFDLSNFNIVSKWMPPAEGENLRMLLNESLSKLNVKRLYGYLAHRPQYVLENPETWKEVVQLKSEGRVGKVGFSLNRPDEFTALERAGIIPDLLQVPYNYFDRRFENVCRTFKERGGEVHTRSAFLQGLFFMPTDKLSSHFTEVKPFIKNLQENYSNLAGELLGFALKNTWSDAVIVGVESVEQLASNFESQRSVSGLPFFDKSIPDSILAPSNWNL